MATTHSATPQYTKGNFPGARWAIVDVGDNSTTVHTGPAYLIGARVETALSAHALPIKDGTTTVFTLAASKAVESAYDFHGAYFGTSIVVDPDDAATGSVVIFYHPG